MSMAFSNTPQWPQSNSISPYTAGGQTERGREAGETAAAGCTVGERTAWVAAGRLHRPLAERPLRNPCCMGVKRPLLCVTCVPLGVVQLGHERCGQRRAQVLWQVAKEHPHKAAALHHGVARHQRALGPAPGLSARHVAQAALRVKGPAAVQVTGGGGSRREVGVLVRVHLRRGLRAAQGPAWRWLSNHDAAWLWTAK